MDGWNNTEQMDMLDALTIVEFIVTMLNYGETVTQTDMHKMLDGAVEQLYEQLERQDRMLEKILYKLERMGL